MIAAKSRLFRASLFVTSFMILGLALASCGASGGQTVQTDPQAATSRNIAMELKFPDGYSYNKANGELSGANTQASRLAPYITRITLTISGNGIAPLTVEVPLDTMAVTVFLGKGTYTFTLTVYTSIGVTFTATSVGEIGSATPPAVSFDLDVNSPPTLDSLTGGGVISTSQRATLIASASDLDDDDILTYKWTSNGGSISGSGNTATFSSGTPGTYTVSVLVSDGHGGTATGNAQVRVVSANSAPSITALTLDGDEYFYSNGAHATTHRVAVFNPAVSILNQGAAMGCGTIGLGNYVQLFGNDGGNNKIKLSCSASDPDSDPLTYKLTTTFFNATRDGNNLVTSTSQSVVAPADAGIVSAVNTFTGPAYVWDVSPFAGVWTSGTWNNLYLMDLTCTVSDGKGGTATLTNRYAVHAGNRC